MKKTAQDIKVKVKMESLKKTKTEVKLKMKYLETQIKKPPRQASLTEHIRWKKEHKVLVEMESSAKENVKS